MTPNAMPTASISEIEKWGRLTMPPSAEDVHAHVNTEGMDALVVLTFEIPADDLDAFMTDAGYTAPLQPVGDQLSAVAHFLGFSEVLPDWPSDAEWERLVKDPSRTLKATEADEPDYHRSILVDQTEPDDYTIFLVHFEIY